MQAAKRAHYPGYKGTEIASLGEIPEHWNVSKLGFHSTVKARLGWKGLKAEEYVDQGFIFLATPNIKGREIDYINVNYITAERYNESPEIMLQEGDVLIAKDGSTLGTANIVRALPSPSTVNSSIAVVRPKHTVHSGYLYWLIVSDYTQNVIQQFKDGQGVPHLFQADLRKFWILLPPHEEQTEIAAFLDYETERIDSLIAKKERQIELLREKRGSFIIQAVTKGLGSGARMKDSGVAWLGRIPAHWMVAPVYARYRVQLGKMLDAKQITGEQLAPYLRNVDVQWDQVNIANLPLMDFDPADRQRFSLKKGDLLVCEGGEIGRTAIWQGGLDVCYYQKALHRLRPMNKAESARFFYYAMLAAAQHGVFQAGADLSTIGHLTAEKLRRHRFAFPPFQEQEDIAAELDSMTASTTKLIKTISNSIDILREFRTALITATVTGKIDVRQGVLS